MRTHIILVTLISVLPALPLSAGSKDDAEIRSAITNFTSAANELDLDRTMACYANRPDISVFSPGSTGPVVGVTAVRKDWSDFFAFLKSDKIRFNHSKVSDIAIESHGSVAFAYFTTTAEIALKDDVRVKPLFRSTLIFQKINSRWLIVHEHESEPREK